MWPTSTKKQNLTKVAALETGQPRAQHNKFTSSFRPAGGTKIFVPPSGRLCFLVALACSLAAPGHRLLGQKHKQRVKQKSVLPSARFWSPLLASGGSWSSLVACSGHLSSPLVAPGRLWSPALVTSACLSLPCSSLVVSGRLCSALVTSACLSLPGSSLVVSGRLCSSSPLVVSGRRWSPLVVFDGLWSSLLVFAGLWLSLVLVASGSLCWPLVASGRQPKNLKIASISSCFRAPEGSVRKRTGAYGGVRCRTEQIWKNNLFCRQI